MKQKVSSFNYAFSHWNLNPGQCLQIFFAGEVVRMGAGAGVCCSVGAGKQL